MKNFKKVFLFSMAILFSVGLILPTNLVKADSTLAISNVSAATRSDGVTVSWTTNLPTDSTVYFTDGATNVEHFKTDTNMVTNHSLSISGLTPSRDYKYHVVARDASGNSMLASSVEQIFTTKSVTTNAPEISNVSAATRSDGVTVSWTTNLPTDSTVYFTDGATNVEHFKTDTNMVTNHSLSISGLTPSRDYKYHVVARDASGNSMLASSVEQIFTTKSVTTNAPEISNVSAATRSDGVTVSWTTNLPTDSTVYFTDGATNVEHFKTDTNMVTNHSLSISGLTPSRDYKYHVVARDASGNSMLASSVEQIFTTKSVTTNAINFTSQANSLNDINISQLLAQIDSLKNTIAEQANQIKYLNNLVKGTNISTDAQSTLNNFITYGSDANTKKLGAGERAAVIYSYKNAFDKLPTTQTELTDVIKIANGRWPSATSVDAESQAKIQFKKIYRREANMGNANDNAAVTVMAYGLKQKAENRNLNSEANGIKTFKAIYGHTPNTTEEWNIMQAITYSGASR